MNRCSFLVSLACASLCALSAVSAQTAAPAVPPAPTTQPAGNEEVRKIMESYGGRGVLRDNTPPTAPKDALKTFKMRDGFTIDMMASEPETCQPLYMSWDSRGRLWVMLYLQYQFPAGLKILSYDQHLRAVFDKVPEPPPRGVKGADKVIVFEDTKGTVFRQAYGGARWAEYRHGGDQGRRRNLGDECALSTVLSGRE